MPSSPEAGSDLDDEMMSSELESDSDRDIQSSSPKVVPDSDRSTVPSAQVESDLDINLVSSPLDVESDFDPVECYACTPHLLVKRDQVAIGGTFMGYRSTINLGTTSCMSSCLEKRIDWTATLISKYRAAKLLRQRIHIHYLLNLLGLLF